MSSFNRPGRLTVNSPGARIEVVDAYLRPVASGGASDHMDMKLPSGAYSVTARIGNARSTQSILLRPGGRHDVELPVEFDAAAPVIATATRNESHAELAYILTSPKQFGPEAESARLVVMLRGLRNREMAPLEAALQIYDANGRALSVPIPEQDPSQHPGEPNRALAWRLDLAPGGYRIRWDGTGEQAVEHAVWLSKGHQVVVFVPQGPHGPVVAGMSVHLLPHTTPFDEYDAAARNVEVALSRVRLGLPALKLHPVPASGTKTSLMQSLLTAQELSLQLPSRDDKELLKRLAATLLPLKQILGDMPDVAALVSSVTGEPLSTPMPFPPMFTSSLDLLLRADWQHDDVIPEGSLTETVSARRYASSPWLLWDPDKNDHRGESVSTPGKRVEISAIDEVNGFDGHRFLGWGAPIRWFDLFKGYDQPRIRLPAHEAQAKSNTLPLEGVDRVDQLVNQTAQVLKLTQGQAVQRLGTDEIARRLGMPRRMVARCLTELDFDDR